MKKRQETEINVKPNTLESPSKKSKFEPNAKLSSADFSTEFALKFVSSQSILVTSEKKEVKKYNINNESDIDELEALLSSNKPFVYDRESDKNITKVNLYVAPVAVFGGLGVYAGEKIKANSRIPLAKYIGKEFSVEDENEESLYIFQLTDSKGKIYKVLDAENKGNETREINHSQTGNLRAHPHVVNGKQKDIYFYAAKDILPDQQLLFDYGKLYTFKRKTLYLHPDDGCKTDEELFLENRKYYLNAQYRFDPKTEKDLQLENDNWLIPEIFQYVCHNDLVTLEQLLKMGHPPDLFVFACKENKILSAEYQQHLTPLHISCYLGYKECAELLIKYGADTNRCMLNTGFNVLALLFMGRATKDIVNSLGEDLLNSMDFPLVTDSNGFSLLHYMITRNTPDLAELALGISAKLKDDFYAPLYLQHKNQQPHADLSLCVRDRKFDLLELLLEKTLKNSFLKKKFLNNINRIFKKEPLNDASLETLIRFKDLLNDENLKAIKKTNLCDCVTQCIEAKVNLHESKTIFPMSSREEFQVKIYDIGFNLFLPKELRSEDLFYKCIRYNKDIDVVGDSLVSPLKFSLYFYIDIAEILIDQMLKFIGESSFKAAIIIKEFDVYACLLKVMQQKNSRFFNKIISMYHGIGRSDCFFHLLMDAINSYNGSRLEEVLLKQLFKESNQSQYAFTESQKERLFICAIDRFQFLQEHSNFTVEKILLISQEIFKLLSIQYSLGGAKFNKPLIYALQKNLSIDFLALLLNEGDINGCNEKGFTPLIVAIKNGRIDQVNLLLRQNANPTQSVNCSVNNKDFNGTPMQLARQVTTTSNRTQQKLFNFLTKNQVTHENNPVSFKAQEEDSNIIDLTIN